MQNKLFKTKTSSKMDLFFYFYILHKKVNCDIIFDMENVKLKAGVLYVDSMEDLEYFFNSVDDIYSFRINLCDENKYSLKNLKLLDYISKNASKLCANGLQDINLIVNYERMPKKIFEKLYDFDKQVGKSINCKVCVNHIYKSESFEDSEEIKWSIKSIVKANTEIDRVCNFIKKNKFSQLEALAFIHTYVSNIEKYHASKMFKPDWYNKDQYFAGIFEEVPQVVCMGYSSLMKEIIDNLKMPGLECEMITVQFENYIEDFTANHARCYIRVKDDKYGINQSCFDDATWDNGYNNDTWSYAHFAMSNKCHDKRLNNVYDYYLPLFENIDKKTATRTILDNYNPYQCEYDIGKNKMDQKTIETIYFNMLQKSKKSQNFEKLYENLKEIASNSYSNQVKRGYSGYLVDRELHLTQSEAKLIYDKNLSTIKKCDDENIL